MCWRSEMKLYADMSQRSENGGLVWAMRNVASAEDSQPVVNIAPERVPKKAEPLVQGVSCC